VTFKLGLLGSHRGLIGDKIFLEKQQPNSDYAFRKFQSGDEVALESLLKSIFPRFKEGNFWAWKYKMNPTFEDSLVALALKDGELIGCNYWMQRDLKLLDNLQVKAALGADIAVNPNHRRFGIGKELLRYPRVSGAFKEKNLLLSYMFGRPELSKRFYKPAAGYIIAPNNTVTYRKLFNCRHLIEKFEEINRTVNSNVEMKLSLKKLTMCVSFKIRGAPEFSLHVEPEQIFLEEGKAKNCDMIIEGNLPLSALTIGDTIGLVDLIKLFLTGKVKIKKGFFHVFRLRKIFVLFKGALDQ
jgi:hypothetical protein